MTRMRHAASGALLVAGLAVSMTVALGFGDVDVSFGQVLRVVLRRLRLGAHDVSVLQDQIVWQLRLPRIAGAAAAGAALACCGVVLQSLTRNDLADPYLLGIAGGAQVGAVTVIVLGVGLGSVAASALVTAVGFAGALAALLAVLILAVGRDGSLPPARTVLAGVVVAQICTAYTSLVVMIAGDGDAARRVLSWTLGSFAGVRAPTALLLTGIAITTITVFALFTDALDAFAFGETSARALGVPVHQVRWALLVITALVTAGVVAHVGAIGFVGLAVPHLARFLTGPRHRLLLPVAAAGGATLMVWADTLARSLIRGTEVPVGAITALVGAPFFVWLMRRVNSS